MEDVPQRLEFLAGGGSAGALARSTDWKSILGEPLVWPDTLRIMVGLVLSAEVPMAVAWGEGLTLFYNDGYAACLGDRHPAAFGRPFHEVWNDRVDQFKPVLDQALAGRPVLLDDAPLLLWSDGRLSYFMFAASPIPDQTGAVQGLLLICRETTRFRIVRSNLRFTTRPNSGVNLN